MPKHHIDGQSSYNTGTADVVFMVPLAGDPWHRSSTNDADTDANPDHNFYRTARTLHLPAPATCEGKTVDIYVAWKGDSQQTYPDGRGYEKNVIIRSDYSDPNDPHSYVIVAFHTEARTLEGETVTIPVADVYSTDNELQLTRGTGFVRLHAVKMAFDAGYKYAWMATFGNAGAGEIYIENAVSTDGMAEQAVRELIENWFTYEDGDSTKEANIVARMNDLENLPYQDSQDLISNLNADLLDGHHASDFVTPNDLQPYALTSALNSYLRLSGADVMTGNLKLGAGTAVKANDKDTDLLAYKNSSWSGVTGEHWFVGAAGVNGFIRSYGELKRWKDANTQYKIWDESNLDPTKWKNIIMARNDDYETFADYTAARGSFVAMNMNSLSSGITLTDLGEYDTLVSFGQTYRTIQLKGQAYGDVLKYRHIKKRTVSGQDIFEFSPWQTFIFAEGQQTITGNKIFDNNVDITGSNKIRFDGANSSWICENADYCLELRGYNGIELYGRGNGVMLYDSLILTSPGISDNSIIYHDEDGCLHLKSGINDIMADIEEEVDGETVTNYYKLLTEYDMAGYWNVNTFKGVKVGNTPYRPQTNGTDAGWINLSDEFSSIGYTISGKVSKNGDSMTGNLTMITNGIRFKQTSNGNIDGAIQASNVTPEGSQSSVECLQIGGVVNFYNDGTPPMLNGNYLATQEWVKSAWKVKDVQVADDNSLVLNGEDVIYGAELASNGMLTLKSTRLSIYVPEYTSDLENDSGFITQSDGDGRYVPQSWKPALLSPSTAGGAVGISSNTDLNEFETSGTYYCQSAAVAGTLANCPYKDGNFRLFVLVNTGTEGRGNSWWGTQILVTGNALNAIYTRGHSGTSWTTWRRANPIIRNTLNNSAEVPLVENLCLPLSIGTGTGAGYATLDLSGYLPLSGGLMAGNIIMGDGSNNTTHDSSKIAFTTNTNYPNISPYIQAIYEADYGRKRLSVFQKNVRDWDTPQMEVLSVMPDGTLRLTQAISFKGTKATYNMISFIDNTADTWWCNYYWRRRVGFDNGKSAFLWR